jgi:hypothetical protein
VDQEDGENRSLPPGTQFNPTAAVPNDLQWTENPAPHFDPPV